MDEFVAVQETANRKRSEMHCIIAALPDGETSAGTPVTAHSPRSFSDNNICDSRNRPILIAKPDKTPPSQPSPPQQKSVVKPKVKRQNPLEKKAKTQEALVFCMENPHLTLKQVAIQYGLEPKALSRPYAIKLKKAMFPNRETREKPSKEVTDDFLYNEKRQDEW